VRCEAVHVCVAGQATPSGKSAVGYRSRSAYAEAHQQSPECRQRHDHPSGVSTARDANVSFNRWHSPTSFPLKGGYGAGMEDDFPQVLSECKHTVYGEEMSPNVLIRNMAADVHEVIVARALAEGLSLQEYLMRHFREFAARPTMAELMDAAAERVADAGGTDANASDIVGWIREAREDRDARQW